KTYPSPDAPEHGIEIAEHAEQLKLLFRRDSDSALEFIVSRDGSNVCLLRPDPIPQIDAISFFIGPVCGVISRLRKKSCLHASVLKLDGRAFALTGDKRTGKSTTSAMLTKCGASLVADDIAVVNQEEGQFWVQPGYPFMRLAQPAIELTGRNLSESRELLSIGEKRYVAAQDETSGAFPHKPQLLDAVYILSGREVEDAAFHIEQLKPHTAARILNSNSYGKYMMDDEMRRQDFSLFAEFAREKHSRAIRRPDNLSRLEELANFILDDFRTIHG
ncbi:MAG: hypothetical protein ABJ193_09845, partial [Parasphingorhabdus sp.]